MDPWSGSSVTQKDLEGGDPSLVVISVPNAAHHYDIRASDPRDTPEVIEARERMKQIVQNWIDGVSRPEPAGPASLPVEQKSSTKVHFFFPFRPKNPLLFFQIVKIEYQRL